MNQSISPKIASVEQQDNQVNEGGFRGQVKLLKRLLLIGFDELVESIGVDKNLINDEKGWKQEIDFLKEKMDIHYHKSVRFKIVKFEQNSQRNQDRSIQIDFLSNLFLFALKHGLHHIKRGDMLVFIKEKIQGKLSIIRSKAILLVLSLLILDVRQSLNEDSWLQLGEETIEDSIKLAKLIIKEDTPNNLLEKLNIIYCSRLITSVCLVSFMNKGIQSLQILGLSIQIVQKCQSLECLSIDEKQEFQFLLINLMKKNMKQAFSGKVKGSYQIMQDTLKYITQVKDYWNKKQMELSLKIQAQNETLKIKGKHHNQDQMQLNSLQNFLLKIQQVEYKIVTTREKAGQKYLQNLQMSVVQNIDNEQIKKGKQGISEFGISTSKIGSYTDGQMIQKNNLKANFPNDRRVSMLLRQNQYGMQNLKNEKIIQQEMVIAENFQIEGQQSDELPQKINIDFINKTSQSISSLEQESDNIQLYQRRISQFLTEEPKKSESSDNQENKQISKLSYDQTSNQVNNNINTSLSRQLSDNKKQIQSFKEKDESCRTPNQIINLVKRDSSLSTKRESVDQSPFISLLQEKQKEDIAIQQNEALHAPTFSSYFHKATNHRYSYFSQIQNEDLQQSELLTIISLNQQPPKENNQKVNQQPINPPTLAQAPFNRKQSNQKQEQKYPSKTTQDNQHNTPSSNQNQINKQQKKYNYHFQHGRGGALQKKNKENEKNAKTNPEFDLQLEILKKSISLAKKSAICKQELDATVDTQSVRTRKSTIASTYTNKDGRSSPVTYLSSPVQKPISKPISILEQYHFTYRDKANAQQIADLKDDNMCKQNPLLEYFGTSRYTEPSSYGQDGILEIKTQRSSQTQYPSPQLRAIQSARGSDRSPFQNRTEKQKFISNNKKVNQYFIGNIFTQKMPDMKQYGQLSQRSTNYPIDLLLTQSLNGSITPILSYRQGSNQGNNPYLKEKGNSQTPWNSGQNYNQTSFQNKNDSAEINRKNYTTSQHSQNTQHSNNDDNGENRLNTERYEEVKRSKKKQNPIINTFMLNNKSPSGGNQAFTNDNYQNLRFLNDNIQGNQQGKIQKIQSEQSSPLKKIESQEENSKQNNEEDNKCNKKQEYLLKGKPLIRNVLNQMHCEKKEQIFLQQMQESVKKNKDDGSYISQPTSPQHFITSPLQNLKKQFSSNISENYSRQSSLKKYNSGNSQQQLIKKNSKGESPQFVYNNKQETQNENYIVSLKDIANYDEDEYSNNLNIEQIANSLQSNQARSIQSNNSNNNVIIKYTDSIPLSQSIHSNSTVSKILSLKTNQHQSDFNHNQTSSSQNQVMQSSSLYLSRQLNNLKSSHIYSQFQSQKMPQQNQQQQFQQAQLIKDDQFLQNPNYFQKINIQVSNASSKQTSNQNSSILTLKKPNYQLLNFNKNSNQNYSKQNIKTNIEIPFSLPEEESQASSNMNNQQQQEEYIYDKMNELANNETSPKRNGLKQSLANRIKEESNFAEKIFYKENQQPIIPLIQLQTQTPSNNTTIGFIQDTESPKILKNDFRQDPEQKFIISGLLDKQSSDQSPQSDKMVTETKSPLLLDLEAHQSFQDYLNKSKNQKSQFASHQKYLYEDSLEKANKFNQSFISSQETPSSQNNLLPKSSSIFSPKINLEPPMTISNQRHSEEGHLLSKFNQSSFRTFKSDNKDKKSNQISDNFTKSVQNVQESVQGKDTLAQSQKMLGKSSFLTIPSNSASQQLRTPNSITPNNKSDNISLLKNISRSFKIPLWAEKNQKKFPSFFNLQMNNVQKKLYNIVECFRTIFILNKFFKKYLIINLILILYNILINRTLRKVREKIRIRKESQQNEEEQKSQLLIQRQQKKPQAKTNYSRQNTYQKKKTNSDAIDLTNSILSQQSINSNQQKLNNQQSSPKQKLMTKEQFEFMQIFRLKQFKERMVESSIGMDQQGEPLNKFIGYFPSIRFSTNIGGQLQVWKIHYEHIGQNRVPRKSFLSIDKNKRCSIEKVDLNCQPLTELQFSVKIDDQTSKFIFKLNQNMINILPANNYLCSTLWPSTYWLFFHNLQQEKNFILEDNEIQHRKKESSISSEPQSTDQYNDKSDIQIDEIEEKVINHYDDIIYKLYHTQNDLKFLNFRSNKSKKFFQLQDLDYIGKLSHLLQQYSMRQGRIIKKINGKTIVFQEKPYDEQTIAKFKYLLNLERRYALYFQERSKECLIRPKRVIVDSQQKNILNAHSKKIKLSEQLEIGLRSSIFNLRQEKFETLSKNEYNFNNYFTFLQKQTHHVINFFLKKKGSYFLISVSIVLKYDLFQRYFLDKKIPFSIYIMAKNMDMNSRVKPIEISEDKFHYFFSEEQIQYEIKKQIYKDNKLNYKKSSFIRFLFRGTLSKFWKLNLMKVCNMSLEIIQNSQSGKQQIKNSKFGYYDQELYIKDTILQMTTKNTFARSIDTNTNQISYYTNTEDLYQEIGQIQSKDMNAQKNIKETESLFEKNFDDIYEQQFIQKREYDMNYNEINDYSNQVFQIKNDFDLNLNIEKPANDSDEEDQGRNNQNKQPNQSLPKEVFIENEIKYDFDIQRQQSNKVTHLVNKDYKKFMERLKDFQKQKGRIFIMKNKQRGVNFILQILSVRNHFMSHNKLKQKYYVNKEDQLSEKHRYSIDCFIYDYEKKQRHFISLKEKKQIRLLLNLIEMNLEGFLMEDYIVKNFQSSLLQEILLLRPTTLRHQKVSPYLKSINSSQREKKLRVDCPLSIMYHLLVDSKQIENYYHQINRNYTLPFKDLGKCFVSASMYYLKCSDSSNFCTPGGCSQDEEVSVGSSHKLLKIHGDNKKAGGINKQGFKFQILLQLHIMPMNQRYKAYKFILSLADLREIDVLLFRHMQNQQFQESMLQRLVKLMSQQFIKVRTPIGSVLAISPDRVQTIHSASGKKVILRLSHFHSYQDDDSVADAFSRYHRSGSASKRYRNAEIMTDASFFEKSGSLSPEELETLARIENRKWRIFVKSLKYSKNKVLKHDFQMNDTVYRKRLMQDIIEQRRIILQRTQKFFDREYVIITVLRDILKNIFVIQLYIPKTCRTIQISFGEDNLNEVNPEIINQWLQQKLLFFHQNSQIPPFSSFLFFSQRVQATNKLELETIYQNEKEEQTKNSIFRWQKINKDNQKKYQQALPQYGVGTPKSTIKKSNLKSGLTRFGNSVQRLSDAKQVEFNEDFNFSLCAKTVIENNERQGFLRNSNRGACIVSPNSLEQPEKRIKKNLAELVRNKISAIKNKPSVIIEYFKPPEQIKAEKLKQFQTITQSLDQNFKKRVDNLKLSHMTRFVEIQIWSNILNDLYFLPNDLKKDIMIMIGDSSFQVQELLHHENLNVDGKQDIQIEISIDLIQSISRPYLIKMRKQYQESQIPYQQMSPTFNLLRQQLLDFYFLPVEFIPYNSTSDFNLIINNFQINENRSQQISINLREIINVFIADGFYKSQSNYQNSRMSYSELKQLCYFVLYKIKKQNFLDLIEKKKIKKPKQQNIQIIKGLSLIDKSYIYETPRQQSYEQPFNQGGDSPVEREKKRTISINNNNLPRLSGIQSMSPTNQGSNRQINLLNQSFSKIVDQTDEFNQYSSGNIDPNSSQIQINRSSRQLTIGTTSIIKPFQILFETQNYEKITFLDFKRRIFLKTTYYKMQNSFKFIVFRVGKPGRIEQIKTLDYFSKHLLTFKYYMEMLDYKEILRQASLVRQQHLLKKFEDLLKEIENKNV